MGRGWRGMMAKYRDDLDAARLRMETLEAKLAERDAELGERDAALAARDAELAEIKAEKERKGSSFFEPSEEQAKPQQRNAVWLLLALLVILAAGGAIGLVQMKASDRRAVAEKAAAEAEHLREKEKLEAERAAREEAKKAKLRALTDADERRRLERELDAARFGAKSAKTGRLNVNCLPPSEVFVDGKSIGMTPLRDHQLAPGTHAVVCKHASAGRASKSVTVEADKATTIVLKL